ncbi:hypothetical protein ACERK3_02815 [Phycisphaerales bacterium AB-hyl4]|uniref:Uncharacterized protein n=1 Tax=Natronomicrosphaera hydrolytica TaxID=3242702 RepID=A0ABV4U223_9BACT
MPPPTPKPATTWPAYALGAVLGCIIGLLAAELSFAITSRVTGRGWADAAWWQYGIAGVMFLIAAMLVMLWLGRRVRSATNQRRPRD